MEKNETLKSLKTELVKRMTAGESFIEDKCRLIILEVFASLLLQLVSGTLSGNNRYSRLILGRKGVGKSALLDAIQRGCDHLKELQQVKLLVVRINCNNSLHCISP